VVDDEESHSCKAIAFINSKGNIRLVETYSEPCMSPQRKTSILPENAESSNKAEPAVSVKIKRGKLLWKK
jgi:hypothetical protein